MNELRTYMSFTYPVDPVKIKIIPDMDLSYALGGGAQQEVPTFAQLKGPTTKKSA